MPYVFVVFDRRSQKTWDTRNVRADRLERPSGGKYVLCSPIPAFVLRELDRSRAASGDPDEARRVEKKLAVLTERERRLVRLYANGEIDEALFEEESGDLKRQRATLKSRLAQVQPSEPLLPRGLDKGQLTQVCAAAGEWLDRADASELGLVLEALQISVDATTAQATIRGVFPTEPPFHCHGNSHADAYCPMISWALRASRSG